MGSNRFIYSIANHSQYKKSNKRKADWDKLQKEQQQQQTVNYPTTQAFYPCSQTTCH